MQCRAPSSATTCSGTPTGQALAWDVEGRLSNWQNTTSSPTVTAKYLYDGEGNRVVQQVVDSTAGSTTTTSYVGRLETYSITTGNQPTNITTTDYVSAGKVLAESVNGTLSYLATSYQGSIVEALDSTGNVGVIASQLYAPYGGVRYQNGALPTDYGYTGQRADAATGLDYYGARYYDPTAGQFTSADTVMDGLNRYGYVGDNPINYVDADGHMERPSVSDQGIQNLISALWRYTAAIGDGSAMAALLQEASTGLPVKGRWHYNKVWDAQNRLDSWFKSACKYISDMEDCQYYRDLTSTEVARLAQVTGDLTVVASLLGYINTAIAAWENSPYYTGTPGQNPITIAPSLPAPSPGMPAQSALPAPGGVPAPSGNLAPVPGLEPTQQVPSGTWQSENRPVGQLPNIPGIARLEGLNTNATRSGLEPFQQRLVNLNDMAPADPAYVPWDPSTWLPRPTWWGVVTVGGIAGAAAVEEAGGYGVPLAGGYAGGCGEHL